LFLTTDKVTTVHDERKDYKMEYLILIIGFVLLIKGADIFVDGCISVAKMFGIPSMIIGLTIVAMGTSAPEASVSISAAIKGASGIAVGNIVGSNLFNLLLIIGLCLLFAKMDVTRVTLVRDYPYYLGTMVLLMILSIGGQVGRIEGLVLFSVMAVYMAILIRDAKKNKVEDDEEYKPLGKVKTVLFIILGLTSVVVGGDFVVDGATEVAKSFGLSEQFIGLSIVAIGTSLPELVTSMAAIKKGENDIAIGNVIGSNIFNVLFVIGIASMISPVTVSAEAFFDVAVCIILSIIVFGFCLHKRKLTLPKGIMMILMYVVFFVYVLIRGMAS